MGSIVKVEVWEVVLIQDCPVYCKINLKDKLIKKSNINLNKEGFRKSIKAVIIVKIDMILLL